MLRCRLPSFASVAIISPFRRSTISTVMFRRANLLSATQDVNRINQYDSNVYSRDRPRTRIVVREKPFVQSRKERLWTWLKPSTLAGDSLVDSLQLGKMAALIVLPLLMILAWKFTQKGAPAALEAKTRGFQNRAPIEDGDANNADSIDYFTVIDKFQERRERALSKIQTEKK
eukprot:GILI01020166.1.p1 GENE.GILI01020166.1~~GILI01020166.1.p1  ORF type:complete len:173 (-),score=29.21 GILI01020166.1:109-627(-)